ncbi:MAG: hypothetical protein Q7S09_02765 [bacterium]|nr:hypothetical protein [bacterium]
MGIFGSLFGEKGEKGKHYAALEIGSRKLRGLLFSHGEGDSLVLEELVQVPYEERKGRATGLLTVDAGAIERAAKTLLEKLPRFAKVRNVSVGLGAEFLRSITFRAVFERDEPKEKIDAAELKNLLEKAERASRESIGEKLLRQNGPEVNLRLVSSRLEEILIDGYGVNDPVGLAGKEIEIALFNLYTEEPHLEFLQAIKKLLGIKNLFPRSLPYNVCRAHASFAPTSLPYSGIFIGVDEALTSVSVVSKNVFLGMKLFSIGRNLFTRSIGENLGLGFKEAEDMQRQYAGGKLSVQVSRKISGILKRASSVWATGVELALEEFSQALEIFPSAIFVYGEGADLPDLIRVLNETDRFAQIPFLEKRTPVVLAPADLPFFKGDKDLKKFSGISTSSADTPICCLAYVSLFDTGPSGELARIVQRATRLAYS